MTLMDDLLIPEGERDPHRNGRVLLSAVRERDVEVAAVILARPRIAQSYLNDSLESLIEEPDLSDADAPLVKALLDKGAKPGPGLLSVANSEAVFRLLLDAGAEATIHTLRNFCKWGSIGIVRILLDHGVEPHSSAMEEAYSNGCYDVCRLLLDRGASAFPLLTVKGALRSNVRQILTPEESARVKAEFKVREVMYG